MRKRPAVLGGVRHYVLTRSAFGPIWDRAANRRRFAITRRITARLLELQTVGDWTWVVLLDERDPLLADRLALFGDSAPAFEPIVTRTCDGSPRDPLRLQRSAAADYQAGWRDHIGRPDELRLTTRIDDDDGFALDALERVRAAARELTTRTILMLPCGVRIWHGRYVEVRHERNAWATLATPPGDSMVVYDYPHTKPERSGARVVMLGDAWAWLWVRHRDSLSGYRTANLRIGPRVRSTFPIDWSGLWSII